MRVGEFLGRSHEKNNRIGSPTYISLFVPPESDILTHGLVVTRTHRSSSSHFFQTYNVTYVQQELINTGCDNLEPRINERALIEDGSFASPNEARRFGLKKAHELLPGEVIKLAR